jgi:hypothetical protein
MGITVQLDDGPAAGSLSGRKIATRFFWYPFQTKGERVVLKP